MGYSETTYLKLRKQTHGTRNWDDELRNNDDKIDTAVGYQHNTNGTHKSGMISGDNLSGFSSATNSQIPSKYGSDIVWVENSGDITSITANAPITGGGSSGSVEIGFTSGDLLTDNSGIISVSGGIGKLAASDATLQITSGDVVAGTNIAITSGTGKTIAGNVTVALDTSSDIAMQDNILTGLKMPSASGDSANKQYVDNQVATVNELSEILSNGNTMGGTNIDAEGNAKVVNLPMPSVSGDSANKQYVDNQVESQDELDEILANGNSAGAYTINMNNNKVTQVATPTSGDDATTKDYVDGQITGGITSGDVLTDNSGIFTIADGTGKALHGNFTITPVSGDVLTSNSGNLTVSDGTGRILGGNTTLEVVSGDVVTANSGNLSITGGAGKTINSNVTITVESGDILGGTNITVANGTGKALNSNATVNLDASPSVTNLLASGTVSGDTVVATSQLSTSGDLTVEGNITDGSNTLTVANAKTAFDHVTADGSSHSYLDQSVVIAASPTFAGLTMAGNIAMDANKATGSAMPSASGDLACKQYVDNQLAAQNELSEVLANGNTAGGTDIDLEGTAKIVNVEYPTASGDATHKGYVDAKAAAQNELDEILANGNSAGAYDIDMNTNRIIHLDTPTSGDNATTKTYVDGQITGGITSGDVVTTNSGIFTISNGTGKALHGNVTMTPVSGDVLTTNASNLTIASGTGKVLGGDVTLTVASGDLTASSPISVSTGTGRLVGGGAQVSVTDGDLLTSNSGNISVSTGTDRLLAGNATLTVVSGDVVTGGNLTITGGVGKTINSDVTITPVSGDLTAGSANISIGTGTGKLLGGNATVDLASSPSVTNLSASGSISGDVIVAVSQLSTSGDLTVEGNITDGVNSLTVANAKSAYDHVSADGTSHTYINQDIRSSASPTFGGLTLEGDIALGANKVTGSAMPSASGDLACKQYVDNQIASQDTLDEILANGNSAGSYDINMNDNVIMNLATPASGDHAANKDYVDGVVGAPASGDVLTANSGNLTISTGTGRALHGDVTLTPVSGDVITVNSGNLTITGGAGKVLNSDVTITPVSGDLSGTAPISVSTGTGKLLGGNSAVSITSANLVSDTPNLTVTGGASKILTSNASLSVVSGDLVTANSGNLTISTGTGHTLGGNITVTPVSGDLTAGSSNVSIGTGTGRLLGGGATVDLGASPSVTNLSASGQISGDTIVAVSQLSTSGDLSVEGNITEGANTVTVANLKAAHDHVSANGSSHSYIDQDVTESATPTFGGVKSGGTISGDTVVAESYLDVNGSGDIAGNLNIQGHAFIKTKNELRFWDNGNYVGFEAPDLSANQIWALPTADGSSGDVMTTDGAGTLSFDTINERGIQIVIDGGGSVITTGDKIDIEIPYACRIQSATVLAEPSGDIVVDIWKDTYANYPPTDVDSITASAPPTISEGVKSQDSTLTGWELGINKGQTLRYNVDSIRLIERATVSLKVIKI